MNDKYGSLSADHFSDASKGDDLYLWAADVSNNLSEEVGVIDSDISVNNGNAEITSTTTDPDAYMYKY